MGMHRRLTFRLTRKDEHWNRVRPCTEDTVQGVNSARPTGHAENADFAGHTRITLSRDRTRLFVVIANVSNVLLFGEGIIKMHSAAPGDDEDVSYAGFRKLVEYKIGQSHLGHSSLLLLIFRRELA